MALELAALNIPIRSTGRDDVLKAFQDIDRAGQATAEAVGNIPVAAPGAAQVAKDLGIIEDAALKARQRIFEEEAATRAAAAAAEQLKTQARIAFQRISQDVAKATADFRLGVIGVEDYSAALQFAREEAAQLRAETGALSGQQLSEFNRVLTEVERGATLARRSTNAAAGAATGLGAVLAQTSTTTRGGVNRMISGFQQLAVMAVGAKSAVGGLATGALISFGASAAFTLGVTAGIAAIAFAFDKLTAASRKTEEQLKKVREELHRQTPQDIAASNVAVLEAAVAKARQELETARAGHAAFTSGSGFTQSVQVVVDQDSVQRAEDALHGLESDLAKARREAEKAGVDATSEAIATLTKAVELGTASNFQRAQALHLITLLQQAASDETKTLEERNRAQDEANRLQAAFDAARKASAKDQKTWVDDLRDQVAVLTELQAMQGLTASQTRDLRGLYDAITEALKRGNITLQERLTLLRALRLAGAGLTAATAAPGLGVRGSFGGAPLATSGATFTPPTFGADGDQTAAFFGGFQGTAEIERQARAAAERSRLVLGLVREEALGEIARMRQDLQRAISESLGESLANGIEQGFEAAFSSGSIGAGFKALAGALLSGLGDAAIMFGTAALAVSSLMAKIKASLASLNPLAGIAASLALIALGGALKGAAAAAFGDGNRGVASVGAQATNPTTRIVIQSGTSGAAQTAAAIGPARSVNVTVIGADDPRAQRDIVRLVRNGERRGY